MIGPRRPGSGALEYVRLESKDRESRKAVDNDVIVDTPTLTRFFS